MRADMQVLESFSPHLFLLAGDTNRERMIVSLS
jgi:hypothetical protein